MRKHDCEDIIRKVWEDTGGANMSMAMLVKGAECRLKLMHWSRDTNPDKLIEQTKKQLMALRKGFQSDESRVEF